MQAEPEWRKVDRLSARRCLPRTLLSQIVFGGGKRNGAMNAIRFHGKRRLRVKLIGQRLLNQLSSLTRMLREGRHLHTAFLPIEMKPGLATFSRGLLPPADREMPIRLLKCAVLDRIGYELGQGHRQCLDCGGAQRDVLRSVERHRSTLSHKTRLRRQL